MSIDPPLEMIAGRRILFAMATTAEFGSELKRRFTPLMVGVGPVEAGISTARVLAQLRSRGQLPDLVVSLGSAGSRTLHEAGVYQAASVSYRDMDATPLGFAKGETPFLGLAAVIEVPVRIPEVPSARLSTGARVISGSHYDEIDADMVDMESYAVLRAAMREGSAFIGLRGISDGRAPLKGAGDWLRFLHVIDANLAAVVDRMSSWIETGGLDR